MAPDAGVVAGLSRHQPLDRALAELFALLAGASRRRVRRPRRHVLADARQNSDIDADDARTSTVSSNSAERRQSAGETESKACNAGDAILSFIAVSTSAKPKAPTSIGISEKPPARSLMSKVKRLWA